MNRLGIKPRNQVAVHNRICDWLWFIDRDEPDDVIARAVPLLDFEPVGALRPGELRLCEILEQLVQFDLGYTLADYTARMFTTPPPHRPAHRLDRNASDDRGTEVRRRSQEKLEFHF
jgi:hypothetical protein